MGLLEGIVASHFSRIVKELRVERVVDVGCRFGWAGHLLAAYAGRSLEVVGLDVYQPYLEMVERVSRIYKTLQVDLEKEAIPLPDGWADVCLCIEVIEHLTKKAGLMLLREMERVTRRGGVILLTTPNGFASADKRAEHLRHRSGWTVKELRRLGYVVKGYGFPRKRDWNSGFVVFLDYVWTSIARRLPTLSRSLDCYKIV